ncbi:MAG: hypothetical protein UZ22_OP11002001006 [Microgenomates bacterium OLB23]|nr:MAG: hypothetical protein UZ22_OP11002001006 [Microgenomates bacterium OLB23]
MPEKGSMYSTVSPRTSTCAITTSVFCEKDRSVKRSKIKVVAIVKTNFLMY